MTKTASRTPRLPGPGPTTWAGSSGSAPDRDPIRRTKKRRRFYSAPLHVSDSEVSPWSQPGHPPFMVCEPRVGHRMEPCGSGGTVFGSVRNHVVPNGTQRFREQSLHPTLLTHRYRRADGRGWEPALFMAPTPISCNSTGKDPMCLDTPGSQPSNHGFEGQMSRIPPKLIASFNPPCLNRTVRCRGHRRSKSDGSPEGVEILLFRGRGFTKITLLDSRSLAVA